MAAGVAERTGCGRGIGDDDSSPASAGERTGTTHESVPEKYQKRIRMMMVIILGSAYKPVNIEAHSSRVFNLNAEVKKSLSFGQLLRSAWMVLVGLKLL